MKATNKGMISFSVSDKERHPTLCFVEPSNILRIPTGFYQDWGPERMQNGTLHVFLISLRVYRSAPMAAFLHRWWWKAELENIILYYLQTGKGMRSFVFPSLHSDPEMPEGDNNPAEIRRFPSDLCDPKFLPKRPGQNCRGSPGLAEHQDHAGHTFGAKSKRKKTFHYRDVGLDVGII